MPESLPASVTMPFPRPAKYGPAEHDAAAQLLTRGRLSETRRTGATAALEDAFTSLTGTRHALSFNSGTSSLHAALHAVGAGPEAGVIVSPMTWISALAAVFHTGSFPLFADLEASTPNLSPHAVSGRDCSAVLVTHAWGTPARMDALLAATDVGVVEDCSHAHGAQYRGRPVGSWGAAGCFSLQESKAVSGGEGGILTTNSREVYETALSLGHHPHRLQEELTLPALRDLAATGCGYKFRMPGLSAAIAHAQLQRLPARMAAAEENLALLEAALAHHQVPLALAALPPDTVRGWYSTPFTITEHVDDPDRLLTAGLAARLPLRRPYDDWLRAPLFHDLTRLHRQWPHLQRTDYTPPDPDAFPHYHRARSQTLLIKIPVIPAADYMHQVAAVLAQLLDRHLNPAPPTLPERTRS